MHTTHLSDEGRLNSVVDSLHLPSATSKVFESLLGNVSQHHTLAPAKAQMVLRTKTPSSEVWKISSFEDAVPGSFHFSDE